MKNNHTDNKFKELLDKLQQESWQLELLISGFAIFGLLSSLDPITHAHNAAIATESYSKFLYPIARISCIVLIINLIIHVILRGLWIGAIGLRYVSGDIDYDYLKYRKRFTNHLKTKVGSFDKYINTLENYCSILFAATFLSLFYIISFFMIFLIITVVGVGFFMKSGLFSEFTGVMLLGFFAIFFLFLAFIVFIDFVTLGYLKKKEWTSFLYFPLYKIFTIITLSFLYRPLVYNFLDNKFGRRLMLTLIPIYFLAFFSITVSDIRSNYISQESSSSKNFTNPNNYFNTLEENQFVRNAAIDSKIINKPILKVFIPFKKKIEDLIIEQHQQLKPIHDNRGFSSNFFGAKKNRKEKDSLSTLYLKAFKKTYSLKIDSLKIGSDFLITEINEQLGFETLVSLKNIDEGLHTLKISRLITSKKTKELEKEKIIDIPFWYYKN